MEKYPYLLFVAENFNINDNEIQAHLTIKNNTKPVNLAFDSDQKTSVENGRDKIELSFSGKINRRDFGLTWDGKNAAGDIFVGDEIKLNAKVQFVKQAENTDVEQLKECTL